MDRQRAEAHLQRVQQRRHGGGTRHGNLVIPLQGFGHAAGHHLGIQPLKRQKQDAEIRCVRHLDVLVVDILCLLPQHVVQRLAHGGSRCGIALLQRRLQMLVGVAGEFCVNGQPDRALMPRQLDGIFHAVGAAGYRGNVFLILTGRKDLL